jgi:hypothetical protein
VRQIDGVADRDRREPDEGDDGRDGDNPAERAPAKAPSHAKHEQRSPCNEQNRCDDDERAQQPLEHCQHAVALVDEQTAEDPRDGEDHPTSDRRDRSARRYLELLSAALFAGRLAGGVGVLEAAEAARAALPPAQPRRASDLLLDGLAVLISDGYAAGAPMMKRALSARRAPTRRQLARGGAPVRRGTRQGGVAGRGGGRSHRGDGEPPRAHGALLLAAWQGREAEASAVVEASVKEVVSRGEALG